jgi:hypothetical protein
MWAIGGVTIGAPGYYPKAAPAPTATAPPPSPLAPAPPPLPSLAPPPSPPSIDYAPAPGPSPSFTDYGSAPNVQAAAVAADPTALTTTNGTTPEAQAENRAKLIKVVGAVILIWLAFGALEKGR